MMIRPKFCPKFRGSNSKKFGHRLQFYFVKVILWWVISFSRQLICWNRCGMRLSSFQVRGEDSDLLTFFILSLFWFTVQICYQKQADLIRMIVLTARFIIWQVWGGERSIIIRIIPFLKYFCNWYARHLF